MMGGPGSGKTVFSLQVLVNAARQRDEAGVFVAPEERSHQVMANVAATFDWDLPALAENKIYILDAHLSPTIVQSGEFDLSGILAILKAKKAMNARWIVLDGIDVLLTLLRDPLLEMREIYRSGLAGGQRVDRYYHG